MVIGRDGKSACASAGTPASVSSIGPKTALTNERCNMDDPPSRVFCRTLGKLSLLYAEHRLRVLVADLLAVGRLEVQRFQHRDGRADVARPLLLVERTVRREQHMVGAEE